MDHLVNIKLNRKKELDDDDNPVCYRIIPTVSLVWPVYEQHRPNHHKTVVMVRRIQIWFDYEVHGPVVNGVEFGVELGRNVVGNGMR